MANNTTVVIAGPGAGKTHNMVEKVLSALNDLKANKYCCVITYTNSATDEIRERISKRIDIPQNLFVGTIHSFLIKFIIEPYAHLLHLTGIEKNYIEDVQISLPKYVGLIPQKAFCEIEGVTIQQSKEIREELIKSKILSKYRGDVNISYNFKPDEPDFQINLNSALGLEDKIIEVIKKRHSSSSKKFKEQSQRRKRNEILLENSVMTYDQILKTAEEIVNDEEIVKKIVKRISYLFIDEYQDLRLIQHNILTKLLSSGIIKGFAIGDPFQYIFDFTYHRSLLDEKKPCFDNTPMMILYDDKTIIDDRNLRSTKEIVNFVRNFTQFKQNIEVLNPSSVEVSFIDSNSNAVIKKCFEKIIDEKSIIREENKFFKTVLFYTPKSEKIPKLIDYFKSSEISNKSYKLSTYCEFEKVFLAAIGYKKVELLDKYNLSLLKFRKICIILYKRIKSNYNTYNDTEHLLNSLRYYVKNNLMIEINNTLSIVNLDGIIKNIFESNLFIISD